MRRLPIPECRNTPWEKLEHPLDRPPSERQLRREEQARYREDLRPTRMHFFIKRPGE